MRPQTKRTWHKRMEKKMAEEAAVAKKSIEAQ
jgi:hypothetical protein